MKVAIYARVSSKDQNNKMQLAELLAYCQARGWVLVEVYQDTATGRSAARPGLDAVMAAARSRLVDVVIVWKLDRFGRSLGNLVANVQELDSLGVRFIAITQGLDTDKSHPASRLLLHILAAMAEFESELISERVRSGIAARRRKGLPVGRQRKVFRRDLAVQLRAQGKSYREIARALGVSKSTVQDALAEFAFGELAEKPGGGPVKLAHAMKGFFDRRM